MPPLAGTTPGRSHCPARLDAGVRPRGYFSAALSIRREIGDRWGEATALSCLGQAFLADGQYRQALRHLADALAIHREVHDLAMQALDLHHLWLTHRGLGQATQSDAHLRQALSLYQRLGMPAAEEVKRLL